MGTNFYWKKLPDWFKENSPMVNDNREDIFIHIGKRSGAGTYCKKCGTTRHRWGGTQSLHTDAPDLRILLDKSIPEERRKILYEREKSIYLHSICPCCGASFEGIKSKDSPIINICSFTWTLMKHKELVMELIENGSDEKIIIDEYGEEFTAMEFFNEVNTPIEYQDASIFC